MSKGTRNRRTNGSESNGKAATHSERADFVSFGVGRSSFIEKGWALQQPWAAARRPDTNPAPLLTPEARQLLEEERNHADFNGN